VAGAAAEPLAGAIEKRLDVARGNVEVDVYAEEFVKGRRSRIVVECKHWASAIPQTVIHAFRTVVTESGANIGYLVSKAGFQSGALTAAELTNLRLLTWEEFRLEFEPLWIEHYMLPTVGQRLETLIGYTEPIVPRSFIEVDDDAVEKLKVLIERYRPFSRLIIRFSPIMAEWSSGVPSLLLRPQFASLEGKVPDVILEATGYRELLELMLEYGAAATAELDDVLRAGGVNVPNN
jgi:restriction system protein